MRRRLSVAIARGRGHRAGGLWAGGAPRHKLLQEGELRRHHGGPLGGRLRRAGGRPALAQGAQRGENLLELGPVRWGYIMITVAKEWLPAGNLLGYGKERGRW